MEGQPEAKLQPGNASRPAREESDLRARYEELQHRVTRFNVVEQDLILTRDRLDRELERFVRIHSFNTRALHARDLSHFADTVADAVIDIFELEFGMLFLTEPESGSWEKPAAEVGVTLGEESGRMVGSWARGQMAAQPGPKPLLINGQGLTSIQAWLPACHLILAPCLDAAGMMTGLVVGGISLVGAPFHDPVTAALLQPFQVFSQQVSALIDNRHGHEIIEEQIRRIEISEERLSLALEGSDAGFWDWDIRTHHLMVSTKSAAILGYKPGELGSAPDAWHERVHPEDLPEVQAAMDAHLAGRTDSFEQIHRLRHREGHYLWVLNRGRALRDPSGVPYRTVGTFLDISPQKEMERRLREAEEAQRAAREQAEAANQAKSAFLAGMSHEIRTPLYGVLGAVQLLRDYPLVPQQVELLQMAEQSATSLLSLIGDILDLSKVEAGKLDLESLPFCLPAVVRESVTPLQIQARARGLSLSLNLPEALPSGVVGDANRLRQILNNLVGNAIKFTHQGGVTVTLMTTPAEGGRLWVECSVRDTGIGIAPEVQARLFNAFVQADSSTTRRYGGSGLGLAICHLLIELMGGRIWVVSQPGQGADFRFRVPFQLAAMPSPRSEAERSGFGEDPTYQGRVLLVEDHPISQRLTIAMLRRMGLSADVATNGLEALAALQRGHHDLILMDCHMPEMDGYEATRAIRRAEAARVPPPARRVWIVALTANAMAGERERCLATGMDDYLGKPFTLARLQSVLNRAFGAARRSPDHPAEGEGPDAPFNEAKLARLCVEIDTGGVQDTVRGFLSDLPETTRAMQAVLAAGHLAELHRQAHSLNGIAATFGLDLLSRCCRELEGAAKAGDLTRARELLAAMAEPVREATAALQGWLQDRGGDSTPPG